MVRKEIENALLSAAEAIKKTQNRTIRWKSPNDPVTAADIESNKVLRKHLFKEGDIWLSEENSGEIATTLERYKKVWIVDPIDGTKEFIDKIPEWAISVALWESNRFKAAGIYNPEKAFMVSGSIDEGVWVNGKKKNNSRKTIYFPIQTLVSRTEYRKGLWKEIEKNKKLEIIPTGSIAYKLSLVAASIYQATSTLVPKNLWDIAAGWALVEFGGGTVILDNTTSQQLLPLKVKGLTAAISKEEAEFLETKVSKYRINKK